MWSFLLSIVALILGYVIYGRFVERIFKPDNSKTPPAITKFDGVDFVPMKSWKVLMIQFLNIAGTGPIFGAIMGAKFGPSCYLWIVFGSIFAGAVHDYLLGMMSLRYDGASLPSVISDLDSGAMKGFPKLLAHYLGDNAQKFLAIFLILFMLIVGAVFVYSPALILGDFTKIAGKENWSVIIWMAVIFVYYIFATLIPIDKIIGKVYPVFALSMIFMAIALLFCLLFKWPVIPEFWDGLQNRASEVGVKGQDIFPCLFITVACGAISGFHATQSPLMARCLTSESKGRPIFYGSMIIEGIVALIWAAVSSYFFFGGGIEEIGATSTQAPNVVVSISQNWLGLFGSILAIFGVVAAPITSGDTAFRSARLMASDLLHIDQTKKMNRIKVSLPLFLVASLLLWYNVADEDGFNVIWRYFGFTNQTLACISLWALTRFLVRNRKRPYYLVTAIPAMFMTSVCFTFIMTQSIGFNISSEYAPNLAVFSLLVSLLLLIRMIRMNSGTGSQWMD